MTDTQISIIRALQNGLPISDAPYDDIARQAGLSMDDLLRQLREWRHDGTIRRFGAVLRHHKAGYTSNAMVVWDVPEDCVQKFAEIALSLRKVSHCYERPRFGGFPYNVYTMIHGRSVEECEATAQTISEKTGVNDCRALYTTKEFKKSSPVYFAATSQSGNTR